jgi:hypothetical protein
VYRREDMMYCDEVLASKLAKESCGKITIVVDQIGEISGSLDDYNEGYIVIKDANGRSTFYDWLYIISMCLDG